MSDEFLPPTGRPIGDDPALSDPDENGYGYYEVEEYSGDPAARPLVDPPFVAPIDQPDRRRLDRQAQEFDPPEEPLQELEFAPPTGPDEPDDPDDLPAIRSGRVPFAERNWRIPMIGVLVAAVVVLITVILLLPDGGLEQETSSNLADLRELPVKQWDEDLDGFSSSVAADDTSMYLVVVKNSRTDLVALDLSNGDERWTTEIGPEGGSATGSVTIVDEGLAVTFNGSSAGDGSFLLVDPASGKISWQSPVDLPVSTSASALVTQSVIGSGDGDGGTQLAPIDYSDKRVGDPVSADAFFFIDDVALLDDKGILTMADAETLQPSDGFRFAHDDSVVDPFQLGDDVVVGVGEQIVRVGGDGAEKYSFDPEVGIIRSVTPMSGDRALVSSATRMRVVALNDDDAEASTSVRSGVVPVLIHDVEGDEFIVVFDGTDRGVGPAAMRVMRVEDDDFDQVSEIELISSDGAPPVMVTGTTVYTFSFGTASRFIAFDLATGERLWSLSLVADDEATVGSEGVIVLTREDDESVVAFYAPAE